MEVKEAVYLLQILSKYLLHYVPLLEGPSRHTQESICLWVQMNEIEIFVY